MGALTQIIAWLNALANAAGDIILAPIGSVPRWLSLFIVSVATGVVMLVAFKYTSNQKAIKGVRDNIRANLYALKLFKESALVALRAQGRMLVGAFWLLVYSVVPMLVMVVPVLLILSQLALWYQRRPFRVYDHASVTVKLHESADRSWPDVRLEPTSAVQIMTGPVRMGTDRAFCWDVEVLKPGYHQLRFQVGGHVYDKELAVGDGPMRVSELRPGWHAMDVLVHPHEKPFAKDSPVQSIEIKHSVRTPETSESSLWIVAWFIISMISGFCLKGVFRVHI